MLNSNRSTLRRVSLITWTAAQILGFHLVQAATTGAPETGVEAALNQISAQAIRADMRFLADDLLEGRRTATRGFDVAARYVAARFEALGLQAAGDQQGYLQTVPLLASTVDPQQSSFTWMRAARRETLKYHDNFFLRGNPGQTESRVEAPIVFAGFGITAPELKYDDYGRIDARGKIVAVLYGAPAFESALKAHYSPSAQKARIAIAHGAVGLIVLNDPRFESLYSYKNRIRDLRVADFRWIQSDGLPHDYLPQLRAFAYLSMESTERLFDGSRYRAAQIFDFAKSGRVPAFDLPVRASITTSTHSAPQSSANVVARLEGSDPILKHEYVIFSAHLDHLGRDENARGDGIFNGAIDNASGTAVMLEIARSLSRMNLRPRRSILFLSVTGEELGLLGSDFFANNPTVPKSSIVANVNMDEDQMFWPLKDVIAYGAEHSTLGAIVSTAAARLNLASSPDPLPERVYFVRSDQYSFVKQGIPAVTLNPGYKSDSPAIDPVNLLQTWEETRYHQPSDDMQQPGLDFASAVDYARIALLCGFLIAEDPQRPRWNPHDFFGEHFGARQTP